MIYETQKNHLAELFGVSTQAIDGWVLRGCPKPRKVGKTAMFNVLSVLRWRRCGASRKMDDAHSLGTEQAWHEVAWLLLAIADPAALPAAVVDADEDAEDRTQIAQWRERIARSPDAQAVLRELAQDMQDRCSVAGEVYPPLAHLIREERDAHRREFGR